ncbi:solute carrier family 2, facilitated glucose transporter member 1-like isoform X2 [Hyperolius riggenbachi]|uniref:solute carrier family 2, facilitated glucose transporter member 1-like isoform X2 n=1 Tax=Hyperolius riggenbachi TaxID=752182 RepID=UPI0035A2C963
MQWKYTHHIGDIWRFLLAIFYGFIRPLKVGLQVGKQRFCCMLEVTWRFHLSMFCVFMGSLLVGLYFGNLSFSKMEMEPLFTDILQKLYKESIPPEKLKLMWTLSRNALLFGKCIGALFVPLLANNIGRKRSLLCINVLFLFAFPLVTLGKVLHIYWVILGGRVLLGVYSSLTSTLISMYVLEVSPPSLRTCNALWNTLFFTCGCLAGKVIIYDENSNAYRLSVFLIWAIPIFLHIVLLPLCPESPHFLFLNQRDDEEAVRALEKLWGTDDIWNEVDELNEYVDKMENRPSLCKLCTDYGKPVFIALVLNASVELSGFLEILGNPPSLFPDYAQVMTRTFWTFRVISIIIAAFVVDLCKKNLLLINQVIMAVCNILLVVTRVFMDHQPWMKYLPVLSTITAVVSYQIGPGPICASISGGLFIQAARPLAMGVASSWSCFIGAIEGIAFDFSKDIMGPYIFLVFAVCQMAAALFTYFVVEDNGRAAPPRGEKVVRHPC